LAKADPHLRIAILEKEIAGFGASGRNGGWCSPQFPTPLVRIAKTHGQDAARATLRAMHATIDEVGRVAAQEGIDAHYHRGGALCVGTSPAQTQRLRAAVEDQRSWGSNEDCVWLSPAELAERLRVSGALGASFTGQCACVHPARLVRGLADVVERLGVSIYEQTPALAIGRGCVTTPQAAVRADVVVRATEAYTATLPGLKRLFVPVYSLMIATAPLPRSFWQEVGWSGRETLCDNRYLIVYAARTAHDRIALGGTLEPYHFGSRLNERFERDAAVFDRIHATLRSWFPAAGDVPITHRWGGAFAMARDSHSSVGFDRTAGLAWAGGYIGDGVATANLAGRTLADLIVGHQSELVTLPWVNHRSPSWEVEPLRWLAATAFERMLDRADKVESSRPAPVRWTPIIDRVESIVGW
jgi:glycine/D-amino acid oxidase-like deaminating enzyme